MGNRAISAIESDFNRSSDTHLIRVEVPSCPDIDLYLKDESTHPTGSLKHRLARSLFLYHLCNGAISASTTVIEASSGSTAVSEAYFARMLGLKFIAVVPRGTSARKRSRPSSSRAVDAISSRNLPTIYDEAARLAAETGGCFLDQFTHAERATDWRGNNNIAESIYQQMSRERYPIPIMDRRRRWHGRHLRDHRAVHKIQVPSPRVFALSIPSIRYSSTTTTATMHPRGPPRRPGIEGIGRQRVEPSFIRGVIDRMLRVENEASFAAMRFFVESTGHACGGSTGTNLIGVFEMMSEMRGAGERGCDRQHSSATVRTATATRTSTRSGCLNAVMT